MSLSGDDRAQDVYDAVTAMNPNFDVLSAEEKDTLLEFYKALYNADTDYIVDNAEIDPSSMAVGSDQIPLVISPTGPCSGGPISVNSGTGLIT